MEEEERSVEEEEEVVSSVEEVRIVPLPLPLPFLYVYLLPRRDGRELTLSESSTYPHNQRQQR